MGNKKDKNIKIWRELFKIITKKKGDIVKLSILIFFVGGTDLIFPLMDKYAIDKIILADNIDKLPLFITVFIAIIIVQSVFVWGFIYYAGKIQTDVEYEIRSMGFEKLQNLSVSYFDNNKVGTVISKMGSDVKKIGEFFSWGIVNLVWGFTLMFGIFFVMIYLNWKLALITFIALPPIYLASRYFQKKILKHYREVRERNGIVTSDFNEAITGIKTTKILNREGENLKDFKTDTTKLYQSGVKAFIFSSLYLPVVMAIGIFGTALALSVGGYYNLEGEISFGTLVAFIAYSVQFFHPVQNLARTVTMLQNAQAAGERIIGLIKTDIEIFDSEEIIKKYGTIDKPNYENWEEMEGKIELKNIHFDYGKGDKGILKGIDLLINKKESVAFVGETGAGKTTIVNLISRFYEPKKGEILIDNKNYKDRSLGWLRGNIGYVQQNPYIFSGTIMENIKYGNPDVSEEEIKKAVKALSFDKVIDGLKGGYNTILGEDGSGLSTGERQILSFVRAIVADPKIIILDEATGSIDTKTEKIIQKGIETLLSGRTSLVIAHRLSTIKSADKIVVIDKGKIVEMGNHDSLIKRGSGFYKKLYEAQFIL